MAASETEPHGSPRPKHSLLLRLSAAVIALMGLGSLGGGLLLITLGGSFYYAVVGVAMIGVAALLWVGRPASLHLFALIVIGTVGWAVWEIGFDWWRLVPRGDIIFLIGAFLLTPWIVGRLRSDRGWLANAGPLAASLAIAALIGLASVTAPEADEWSGQLPGPRTPLPAQANAMPSGDWFAYGGDWRGTKWSPLTDITPANVDRLAVAWTFHTGDRKRAGDPEETTYELTPIKIGDTLYACTPHNLVIALDAESGRERWRFDPHMATPPNLQHLTCRGVSYHDASWPGATRAADCPQRIITATNDARLIALDAQSGRPCRSFGREGQIDLRPTTDNYNGGWFQFTSAPLVTRGLIIVAGAIYDNAAVHMPSGVIRAFDVATGKLVWNFDPGNPDDTAPIAPGRHYVISTPNSWSTAAADEGLGLVYLPMGNGAVDQWGGARSPETERFTATILALDIKTGRMRWAYQTVHHDLWDMDVPAQPALLDLAIPGRGTVPALVQSTKTGNIFILDRRTGQPIHPVVERPVPGGPAPGDHLSPTQPYSSVSLMPKERVRETDMWGATMFDQLACRIAFRRLRYDGPFTPPSLKGSLVFPGNFGVMDWGGMAIDPVRQIAFAHPNYMAFVDQLLPQSDAGASKRVGGPTGGSDRGGSDEHGLNPNKGAPFAVLLNPFLSKLGLPCQAPPWGYVAGVDLVSGKTVWRHKNGTTRDESPLPIPLKLGVPTLGGPMTTAGGVAFMSSSLDYYLRAYDVTTGRVLWRARLPAGAQATPMTYSSPASGRQFVVTVAGGHGSLGTKLGDAIIAYALPRGR